MPASSTNLVQQACDVVREVVRGDFVLLAEGDRVPADGVLVDCVDL